MMSFKKIILISAFTLVILPALSFADITIVNNTDYYGTGYTSLSPCSSKVGVVVQPHQVYTVSQSILDLACGWFGCEAHVFMTNDCSGKELATVELDSHGITKIVNHDKENFEITGGGTY